MLKTITIPRSAPWLPPSILAVKGEIHFRVRFSKAEQKIFRRGKKHRPSQWCELYRVVTMSSLPGKWKNEVTPYLAGIMDASFYPSVREITVCAAPQTGKSESVTNCIGVAIDQEPGPAIIIFPDEKTSNENCEDRYQAMIKNSPRLRTYMTGMDDDLSRSRIGLIHMPIYFGWARSASSMANKPCRYAVNDEVDKYVEGKRETSAIIQTKNRLATYDGQEKHWIISSPTIETGPIWKYFNSAQVRFDFIVKCPTCGVYQKMQFRQIKWPHRAEPGADGKCHSEDPDLIEANRLAWYECPHCLANWNDYERDMAVHAGEWHARIERDGTEPEVGLPLFEYLTKYQPARIAFHIPAWLSRFVSLGRTAASFLRGLADLDEFKNFHNKHCAEPWKRIIISKNEDQVLAARCSLSAQIVPEEAIALTCGIDYQKYGFWFVVRAWASMLTSWNIHYGFLATWEDVERLLFETSYPVGDTGQAMQIFRALLDTGGGKLFDDMTMTEEAYFWLIKNRGRGGVALWGAKGSSTPLPGMLHVGNEILSTPGGKKLPDGLRLVIVDTNKAKDQFHYRLQLAANPETRDLPGAAFLHAGTGADYAGHILAEQKLVDERGHEIWVNEHHRPNHLSDAEYLSAACIEMEFPGGGLRLLAEYAQQIRDNQGEEQRAPQTKQSRNKEYRRW